MTPNDWIAGGSLSTSIITLVVTMVVASRRARAVAEEKRDLSRKEMLRATLEQLEEEKDKNADLRTQNLTLLQENMKLMRKLEG